jgi:hypothetical protein
MSRNRLLTLTLLSPFLLVAQDRVTDHNLHGWFIYFGDHPVGRSKWGVHLEGQVRRHDFVTKWQQLLLRPGVNYQASKAVLLTAGYGFVRANTYSEFAAPGPATREHRIWEQAWIRYRTGTTSWNTRLRFENRFLEIPGLSGSATRYRYQNRFRAWQQIRIPIAPKKYFTAYDEFFVHVKPYQASSFFDQNRAYAGLGFELKPTLRLEIAYMNQLLLVQSGRRLESNHTIVLSLFSTASLFKRH